MPTDLSQTLTIAVSSRALFELEAEDGIFQEQGVEAYRDYQLRNESSPPAPGAAFPLIKGLLAINDKVGSEVVTVTLISRNSPELSLRLMTAADHHGLKIKRWAFTSGDSVAQFLQPYQVDLFLSRNSQAAAEAVEQGIAAAVLYPPPPDARQLAAEPVIFALDADAVIFSSESEQIYKAQGLEAFLQHESENAKNPMKAGPFGRLLKTLSTLQKCGTPDKPLIRIAIVTARNAPAHERVLRTLRLWDIAVDQLFMMGGLPKAPLLEIIRPHIFFDDQAVHAGPAAEHVPTGQVPETQNATAIDVSGAKSIPSTAKGKQAVPA